VNKCSKKNTKNFASQNKKQVGDTMESLTKTEERLLEVMLNPNNVGKSISELCQLAGISRVWYYKLMEKESFKRHLTKTANELIKDKLLPVVNATLKYALQEKGHQDRKLILTMANMYRDKSENININTEFDSFSDEDIKKELAQISELLNHKE
jgi:hypothetical protein